MKTTFTGTMQPLDTTIPDPALIVMIGASGSGKSTLASSWPATQVLELDAFRAMIADDAGDQSATEAAITVMHAALKARMARRLTTVISDTNTDPYVRKSLIDAACAHGVPVVALLAATPADVCVRRQAVREPARAVPEDVVRRQHADAVAAFPNLRGEGFDHVVFADNIHRLEPLLKRASDARRRDMGWDGSDGLGPLLLVRRVFGPDVLPLWTWRDGSGLAGGDRVGEIRLGKDRLVLALRTNVDGEGDFGFDLLTCCPYDDECDARAWQPVHSVTDLLIAHASDKPHPDTVCTVHGGSDDHDQGDDPEGCADLEAQALEAISG
ncbi:ATP-binding protein (plasmid) [Streptomyces sp. NBC_00984]|uniref:ATP-binding protein n=1 Tax=Streptomyces sp. NBC_00984 TaxID=2903700 RepID=UPI002F9168BD|nr:ATP-binding protein [Streptomyces sp. NBC_00984]